LGVKLQQPNNISSYNLPRRREALLEIQRLIVEEGLSHDEIQIKLNLPSSTYFRYLDILLRSERAIVAKDITSKHLLNEILILRKKYLRRRNKVDKIADDGAVDAEAHIKAHHLGAELDKATLNLFFEAPTYLVNQRKIPSLSSSTVSSASSSTTTTATTPTLEEEEEFYGDDQQH
jgi:hypothetical protein